MASDLAHPPSPSRSTHVPGSLSQRPRLPEWAAHLRPSDPPAPGTDDNPKGPRGTQRRPCSTRLLAGFRWDFPSFRAIKEQKCSSNSKDSKTSLQRPIQGRHQVHRTPETIERKHHFRALRGSLLETEGLHTASGVLCDVPVLSPQLGMTATSTKRQALCLSLSMR